MYKYMIGRLFVCTCMSLRLFILHRCISLMFIPLKRMFRRRLLYIKYQASEQVVESTQLADTL